MKTFSSLAAVMALWLAVSFFLWLFHRLFRRRDGSKQKRIVSSAIGQIDEGAAIFSALRTRAPASVTAESSYRRSAGQIEEALREDVQRLLNGIEAQSSYFEQVNAAKKKIQKTFGVPDFLALSEILQIRRDFWAASEIFLMDGIQALGPELADAQTFEAFQAEARQLLFKDGAPLANAPASQDPVELRLAIAREEASAFQAHIERVIAAELEKSRFPTPRELIAVPWSAIKGAAKGLREIRYLLGDAAKAAQSLARAMTSKGLKGTAEELRRARMDMPGQFATAFERAGGLARQGGQSLKRHYEFVLEAQELRARYAELLARAPDISEKGKQFLARLELERRAEQFRETSGDAFDWARQMLVAGIAYLIAGLQYVQAKVTPAEHKQLAMRAPDAAGPAAAAVREPETPLRVLLLPASAYSGGNHGQRRRPGSRDTRPKAEGEVIFASAPEEWGGWSGRLRDLLTGDAALSSEKAAAPAPAGKEKKPHKDSKPRFAYSDGLKKTSFKDLLAETAHDHEGEEFDEALPREMKKSGKHATAPASGGSLLDRLASIGASAQVESHDSGYEKPGGKSKGWPFSLRSKRK
ncbi:MAG: hypothetical protein HY765_03810 [Rhodomicrobium sp.]|nr:hypothetical protein [Rhodomicrobium sp.]